MKIRNATNDEIAFIREQRVNAYNEHGKILPEEHWSALKRAISSEADSQEGVELIVAELEGKIVGSVALFPPNIDAYEGYIEELDYSEIRMLAVAPDARGKGVASALVTECIERTKARGHKSIGLHTGEFMKSAIRLYEQFGFERVPQYDFEPAGDGIIVKGFRLSM